MFIVSISGNSGCGKSTLLRVLAKELETIAPGCVLSFDESQFHHPQLERMFQAPREWALPIQVNFVLQRGLTLLHAYESAPDSLVLMERSIEEDALFLGYYEAKGYIRPAARAAYAELVGHLTRQIPPVSCHIFLDGAPAELASRIEEDIRQGRRGTEISGIALFEYLQAIGNIYATWSEGKRDGARSGFLWLDGYTVESVRDLADQLLDAWRRDSHV